MKVRALIIAREPLARERIKSLLSHQPEVEMIGEYANSSEALAAIQKLPSDVSLSAFDDPEAGKKYPDRVMIKAAKRAFFLKPSEIELIQAEDNYVRLYFNSQTCLLREKMKVLEAKLNPHQFVRIHRSAIVNLEYIKEMRPCPNGEFTVFLHNGTQLTLSRSYRDRLFALFEQWS